MIVAFDATSIVGNSGIEVYARELLQSVVASDCDVKYRIIARQRRGDSIRAIVGDNCDIRASVVNDLLLGRTLRPLTSLIQTRQWNNTAMQADLAHVPGNKLSRIPNVPFVVTIHDVFPLDPEIRSLSKDRDRFRNKVIKVAQSATRVIVPSAWAAESIREAIPAIGDKIRVVHHSVRSQFQPQPLRDEDRARLSLPNFPYLFFVGRADPRKNLSRILEAWCGLPESLKKQSHLVIVMSGSPRDIESFRNNESHLLNDPSVILRFNLDDNDVIKLYSSSHGLVFSTLGEGFGIPVLEAMQCGCPVLTSNVTALPEVAGDAAILVDPTQVPEIGLQMERLLTDEATRVEYSKRGLERAKLFTARELALKTVAVYREVLGG